MRAPGRTSFVRAAATTYATNAGAAALSLANVLIVARSLGATGRGDVAFLIAVSVLSAWLASLSIQEANANIGGSEADARPGLATNSLIFALLFGILAAVVVLGLVAVFPRVGGDVARPLLYIALAAVPMSLLKPYLSFLVQADYGFAATNLAWIISPITTVTVNGVLALTGVLSVGSAITAWAVGQTLGVILLILYISRHAGFGRPDLSLGRRALGFGARTHIGHFMSVGNYRVDQWFLGSMAGSKELGLYSIAVAWAEMLFYLPGILVLVQRPDLVRAKMRDAAQSASRVFRGALVLAVGASAVLIIAAPVLCVTVFGEEFRGSIDDLRVLALGAFGIVAVELLRNALTAQRRPLLSSAAAGVAFALTITLDIILIPLYGGLGAAIATTVAYTGGGIAVILIFSRALRSPMRDLIPRPGDLTWLIRGVRNAAGRPAADKG